MGASAVWVHRRDTMTAAPLFGGRRGWLDYSVETTGYGSVELGGLLTHRVTIVHPADQDALRRHHRLVRNGRLAAGVRRSRDAAHVLVVDREELSRTGADAPDSWLAHAQRVARLCGTDDEVARVVGPALRQLLWTGRPHLGHGQIAAAFAELRAATEDLVLERTSYRETVDRWVAADHRDEVEVVTRLDVVAHLLRDDIDSIRLETMALAEVRRELDGPPPERETGC